MINQNSLQQNLLNHIVIQNQVTCSFAFEQITSDNVEVKLNEKAVSVGFIYRHIGEMMNMFGLFFGIASAVQNTTMGEIDKGQGTDVEQSKILVKTGYAMLEDLVKNNSDSWWMEEIETPFFGKVTRIRLFSHVLYHNAHHSGQISLTLSKGQKF